MAALIVLRRCRYFVLSPYACSWYSSSTPEPPDGLLKTKIIQFLSSHLYDFEYFLKLTHKLRNWSKEVKNRKYTKTSQRYGDDIAAVNFVLNLKGRVRLQGQNEWFPKRDNIFEKYSLFQEDTICIEGVDVSGSIITYDGLMNNLVPLKSLKCLHLSRCPYVDDWFLNRLYLFAHSLEELSLAGCPQVTEKGLTCLHHLENLKRLDVSDIPRIPYKGLVRILVEEMLPRCEIVGMDSREWAETDLIAQLETYRSLEPHTDRRNWDST